MVTERTDKYAALSALFRAGLEGHAASYHLFLQNVTPLLRGVIIKKLPISDVEDTLQEILISIHKARHTYDGERPLMPWLMAIAKFRIADALRKAYGGINRLTVDSHDLQDILADVTEPEGSTESVHTLLANVPERERKILTLMHVEGYTAKETGVRLGMNESAVKVAAHRAIKKIREKMGA